MAHGRPKIAMPIRSVDAIALIKIHHIRDVVKVVLADDETTQELISVCKSLGIYQGAYKRNWDVDAMELSIYKAMKDIVHVSIKIDGSFVEVEAVEKTESDSLKKRDIPSNVIAEKACVIQEIILYNGYSVVEVGDVVQRGQLLVSAIVPSKDGTKSMIVGACADIKGRVWYTGTCRRELYDIINVETGQSDKCFKILFGSTTLFHTKSNFEQYIENAYEYNIMPNILPISLIVYDNKEIYKEAIELSLDDVVYAAEAQAIEEALKNVDDEAIILNTSVESKLEDGVVIAQAIVETSEIISIRVLINSRE